MMTFRRGLRDFKLPVSIDWLMNGIAGRRRATIGYWR
jgi:hypothetical protein